MLKLTKTQALPEKACAAALPGLQSLLKCALTYIDAAMRVADCHRRSITEAVRAAAVCSVLMLSVSSSVSDAESAGSSGDLVQWRFVDAEYDV